MNGNEQPELDLAERLAEISILLAAQRSAQEARDAAVRALEGAGLRAGFYAVEQGALAPLALSPQGAPPLDPALASEALAEGRPAFAAGEDGSGPAPVACLPLQGPAGQEVLVLAGAFTPRSHGLLRRFAEQLSQVYSTARRISDLESQHRGMRLLLELARTTTETLEVASIMGAAADGVVRLLEASAAFILLREEDGAFCIRAASSGRDSPREARFPPDHSSVVGRTGLSRAPVVIPDVRAVPASEYSQAMASRYGTRAVLGMPILSREELIGVLLVVDKRPRHFSPQHVELAQATAGQLALSIANARLYESARRSYEVLQETRAAMTKRERLATLGELAAVVAHEVRNPLGVIFNAVSSLRRMLHEGEPQALLDILAEESDRLNRLVGELLDFSRPRVLSHRAEDVGTVIRDALEAAASDPSTAEGGVRLVMEVEPHLPPVPMDKWQIRQALVNVVVNALQVMPRGGVLKVTARRAVAGKEGGGPRLQIDLSDDGPGIRPDLLPRVFEPFFTTKATGTGLGLAVVKRIVEDHGGKVDVSSEVGRGTTFTIHLPMHG